MFAIVSILMYALFYGLIIFGIVHLQRKRKKKKEEEIIQLLERKARECTDIYLPPFYFEELYMQWLDTDESIEQKVEKTKNNFQAAKNSFEGFVDAIKTLDTVKNSSLFLESQEEKDAYTDSKNPKELEDQISSEISLILPLVAPLKRMNTLHLTLSSIYFGQIIPHQKSLYEGLYMDVNESEENEKYYESSLAVAKRTHDFALMVKWNEICISCPHLNNEIYKGKFFEIAKQDDLSFKEWKIFYTKNLMQVASDLGGEEWMDAYVTFAQEIESYQHIYKFIQNGFGEFSSIHEITDFSEEESGRIVNLYRSGAIRGVYSKAKDPKYN